MTLRKQHILDTALELFAKEGFASTSTRKIAKKAGVSEGLIFRHFRSKQELLDALTREAEDRTSVFLGPILFESNPRKIIRKTIRLPFRAIDQRDLYLFRIQLLPQARPDHNMPGKMRPLTEKLTAAFSELKYKEPEKEARLLNHVIHDLLSEMVNGNPEQTENFKKFLLKKYKVR